MGNQKLFYELLSPSIKLKISGESSLSLFVIVNLWKSKSCVIGDIHCALFSHYKTSTANETTLIWQSYLLACLTSADGDRSPKRCLLLALQSSCSEQFTHNFCVMNSKFHLEFYLKMQGTIRNIVSKQEKSWLGVYIDQSCVPFPKDSAFPSFWASPSSTSFPQSPYPHMPKFWTAKLK